MPDPKLQAAAEEIKDIMKKHDIGGLIVLASPTHLEFLHKFDPSWSCASYEVIEGLEGIRIRCKREDFPSVEAQKKSLEDTVGMMMGIGDHCRNVVEAADKMALFIGNQMGGLSHWSRRDDEERGDK